MALPLPFTDVDLQGERLLAKYITIEGETYKQLLTEASLGEGGGGGGGIIGLGTVRVSPSRTILEHDFVEDAIDALLWDQQFTGGAARTHNTDRGAVVLSITAAVGDKVIRQSKQYFPYTHGRFYNIKTGFRFGAAVAGVRKRVGFFDASDGFFLEQDDTGALRFVLRSSATGAIVNTVVEQADWNVDTFDGNGTSGVNLDIDKIQMLYIEFYGRPGVVRIGFVVNGLLSIAHAAQFANVITVPGARRLSLPIRYELENISGANPATVDHYGAVIETDSQPEERDIINSVDNFNNSVSVNATLTPLLSIRLKAANIRGSLFPKAVQSLIITAADAHWRLILNGVLTGPAWTSVSPISIAEVDVTASAISGGTVIDSGYISNAVHFSKPISQKVPVVADIAGTPDTLTLAAVRVTGAGAMQTFGQLNFQEIY